MHTYAYNFLLRLISLLFTRWRHRPGPVFQNQREIQNSSLKEYKYTFIGQKFRREKAPVITHAIKLST